MSAPRYLANWPEARRQQRLRGRQWRKWHDQFRMTIGGTARRVPFEPSPLTDAEVLDASASTAPFTPEQEARIREIVREEIKAARPSKVYVSECLIIDNVGSGHTLPRAIDGGGNNLSRAEVDPPAECGNRDVVAAMQVPEKLKQHDRRQTGIAESEFRDAEMAVLEMGNSDPVPLEDAAVLERASDKPIAVEDGAIALAEHLVAELHPESPVSSAPTGMTEPASMGNRARRGGPSA